MDQIAVIPNNLKITRRKFGYSRKQVAVLLELRSEADVARWERGQNMPTAINLLKLAALYRTSPNELYYDLLNQYKQRITLKEAKLFDRETET